MRPSAGPATPPWHKWTLHNREHLVLLRPGRFGLLVHTLFYADEVRALDEFRTETEWVTAQELDLAHRLVESLAGPFEPAKYQDGYRQNLRALIDTKVRGEEVKTATDHPSLRPVPDILEALKASLAQSKKPTQIAPPEVPPKTRRKAIAS